MEPFSLGPGGVSYDWQSWRRDTHPGGLGTISWAILAVLQRKPREVGI